jgi:hypothetical protein
MRRNGAHKKFPVPVALTALSLIAALSAPGLASAQFTVAGRKVPPAESNFAGVRQVTPRYGLVVQINHDVRTASDFELSLVDEIYASLLLESARRPVVKADALPLVITTQAKLDRFSEGGRRRMFRFLEPELRKHPDLHLSPTAIFISDGALGDEERLRSLLMRALRFHFDDRLREAIESMDRPIPDRP